MKVGELFINLGLTGADATGKALGTVKTGLTGIRSISLETKAAIIGIFYGLEKLTSASAQWGTDLTNMTTATGLSTKAIQQWDYVAQKAGGSAEEMNSSFKNTQKILLDMQSGMGPPPAFLEDMMNSVQFDPDKINDMEYFYSKAQEYLSKLRPEVAQKAAQSFGFGEHVGTGMQRGMFSQKNRDSAPIISDRTVRANDRVNQKWNEVAAKIKKAFADFTGAHGEELVKQVGDLAIAVMNLVEALQSLGIISRALSGFKAIITGVTEASKALADISSKDPKRQKQGESTLKSWLHGFGEAGEGFWEYSKEALSGKSDKKRDEWIRNYMNQRATPPQAPGKKETGASNVEVNQNMYFQHDGKNAQQVGMSTERAVKTAYWQLSALSQEA